MTTAPVPPAHAPYWQSPRRTGSAGSPPTSPATVRDLTRRQVDRQQPVAGADQDRRRAGSGLLEHRSLGHLGLRAADDREPAAGRVEDDGDGADRGERDRVAELLTRELLGAGRGEAGVPGLPDGDQLAGGGRDGVHAAVEGDRQGGVRADGRHGVGLVREGADGRDADRRVLAGDPQLARDRVQDREAAAGHADVGVAGDRGVLAVGHLHLGRVERQHARRRSGRCRRPRSRPGRCPGWSPGG